MSGFRKCGIYPLNPGQTSDRQLAPSHAFIKPKPVSILDEITPEQEKLYQKRYEEGFDLDDPKYSQWLKAKGLHASDEKMSSESVKGSPTASVVSTCAPDSDHASLTVSSSVSTSDVLGDLLTLPQPKITKKKRKPGFNQKAVCITDDKVLHELEEKIEQKERKEKERNAKQIERVKKKEQKKKEAAIREKKKEGRKKTKEDRVRSKNKDKMTKTKRGKIAVAAPLNVDLSLEDIKLLKIFSDTESEAECPKCGIIYGETEDKWICCDLCDTWLDLKCADVAETNIPNEYYCSDCL